MYASVASLFSLPGVFYFQHIEFTSMTNDFSLHFSDCLSDTHTNFSIASKSNVNEMFFQPLIGFVVIIDLPFLVRKTRLQFIIERLHRCSFTSHLTFRSCRLSSTIKIPFKWNSRFTKNTWSASTKSSSCFFDTSFTSAKIMIMLMEQIIFKFKLLFYIIHFVSSFNTYLSFLVVLKDSGSFHIK